MAPQPVPQTPSIPPPKRNVFGISSSNRRQSVGPFPAENSASPSLSVASSPQLPTTPAGPGIPSFRALRSFLPFGPSKNASPTPAFPSSPNPSMPLRTSFGFGSVRRSMNKERDRKMSLTNEATMPPILAIERSKSDSHVEDTNLRRSVSLSRLDEPLLTRPLGRSSDSAPVLRTPSPGIPLSQELSTIMEADSSGISRNVPIFRTNPSSPSESRSPSPDMRTNSLSKPANDYPDCDADTSMLDLSPSQLTREVMDAMRASESPSTSALDWSSTDKAVIIDADGPNDSFSVLPAVDPGLAALLSPNSIAAKKRHTPSFLPRLRNTSKSPASSPVSSRFPTTPVTPTSASMTPRSSPPKSVSPAKRSPSSTSIPAPLRSCISNPTHLFTPAASSSLSSSTGSKFINIGKGRPPGSLRKNLLNSPSSRTEGDAIFPSPPKIALSTPSPPPRHTRASLDSKRSPILPNFAETPRRPSLDIPHPAHESVRRTSFEIRRGTSSRSELPNLFLSRASPSPEPPSMLSLTINSSPSPAPDSRFDDEHRSPLDSLTSRHSLESSRPGSAARMQERVKDRGTGDRSSPVPGSSSSSSNRMRKRSMSVQDRFGAGRNRGNAPSEFGVTSSSRPGSSMSVGYARRGEDSTMAESSHLPSKSDWLTSRTSAKAFRAAGLMEYDRESERDTSDTTERLSRDRSGSLSHNLSGSSTVLAPSPLSQSAVALGRFGFVRGSASEYNPSHHNPRAYSRMAFSDAGGPALSNRRGSGSFSTYGSGGGLMESPTFTTSSGSRDRDTPRSTGSTAATSVSGYGARESRDRDEVRELRDKHSTEMEALLNALSDSQRTVRMLREENADLRDRLDKRRNLEAENDELAQICNELRRECAQLDQANDLLRREMSGAKLNSGRRANEAPPHWNTISLRTPIGKQDSNGGGHNGSQQYEQDDRARLTIPSSDRNAPVFARDNEDYDAPDKNSKNGDEPTTPHPARRGSIASSIFPAPPSNMSMLLHEDPAQQPSDSKPDSKRSSAEQFRFPIPPTHSSHTKPSASISWMQSPARTGAGRGCGRNHSQSYSISSANSVSPTTANFSFATGSPGSLFLKPEHEMFLGDMESLDLGVRLDEDGLVSDADAW